MLFPSLRHSNEQQQRPIFLILGSGGHTTEMAKIYRILLLNSESIRSYLEHHPKRYLVANTDTTSEIRFQKYIEDVDHNEFIMNVKDREVGKGSTIIRIPRSREVNQSWFTTILTTLYSFLWSIWLVYKQRPQLILCNGPGTCVPICLAVFLWRLVGLLNSRSTKIIYIESFCRVQTLSLSGRILLPIVDLFIVQWETLAKRYSSKKQVKYFGRLI